MRAASTQTASLKGPVGLQDDSKSFSAIVILLKRYCLSKAYASIHPMLFFKVGAAFLIEKRKKRLFNPFIALLEKIHGTA